MRGLRHKLATAALFVGALAFSHAQTQQRTRLVMKDGTYQWVLHYEVKGDVVQFTSAERDSAAEQVPLALVDLPATQQWARDHAAQQRAPQRSVLSPSLAKEEADRAARTPEVAPDLKLPEELSVVALDDYQGQPELVPLQQKASGLNAETAHDAQPQQINPSSVAHDIYDLRAPTADVRLHTLTPTIFVRVGIDDEGDVGGSAIMVDTHGASGRIVPSGGSANSRYVIEKLRVRNDSREVDSFRIAWLGQRSQPHIIETNAEPLVGSKWVKLTPATPLEPGEYALIEVLGAYKLNLDVWDFAIQPKAGESMEAIRPETKKPIELERRRPE